MPPKKPSKLALAVAEEIQGLYEALDPSARKLPATKRKREIARDALDSELLVERILARRKSR